MTSAENKDSLGNLFSSINSEIITKQNKIRLIITIKESKLSFYCYFFKDYFKISFENSFSLDELREGILYYNQFTNINEVYKELSYNITKKKPYLEGNENLDNKINLVIPITAINFPNLKFDLNKKTKNEKEVLEEYKNVVNIYKYKLNIYNLDSKILAIFHEEKELLKSWIEPTKKLEAKLLYSFYVNYKENFIKKTVEIDEVNMNKIGNVEAFHQSCDNKPNILILCKSKNEIFGGFTPLYFTNKNVYGSDNKSFLFSINRKEKYPKNSYENNESIWSYEYYGPCFHWDFYFKKYKMHVVEFENKTYFTPYNWVNIENCYKGSDGVLLDSLEIFQITIKYEKEENDF